MIQAVTSSPKLSDFSLAEEIFGEDFDVWMFQSQWHRVRRSRSQTEQMSVPACLQLMDWLQQVSDQRDVQLHRLNDQQMVCLLPSSENSQRTVAVRTLPDRSDELMAVLQRAASAAVRQQQRTQWTQQQLFTSNSQLAAVSARISQGHAELEWLHGLSLSGELSPTRNDPQQFAQLILPEMCRLIHACTVVYVDLPTGTDSADQTQKTWQVGDVHVPERVVRSLIREVEPAAVEPAVLRNYTTPVYADDVFPGVLSCIVKAIGKGSDRIGWILAINKDLQYLVESRDPDRSQVTVQQECMFGAFESGLVEAAANALAAHARNCSLLDEKESIVAGTIRSLVNAIDAKDSYTSGHSDRVAEYARRIAESMGLSETFCRQIHMTGLLHDVGKIGVPDSVLQKPGRLTSEEFDRIKQHPVIGHEILQHLAEFDYVLPGVLHHHEAIDGSGYPYGLAGDDIPLMARILAVADAYDAMTSDRPYRDGMSSAKAEDIINNGAGQQWDSGCVEAFRNCIHGLRLIGHRSHQPTSANSHVSAMPQ